MEWQVHFYIRYVDDSNIITYIIEADVRVVNNEIVKMESEIVED